MKSTLNSPWSAKQDELEIASFYLGDALMGISIDSVEEINHHLDLTPVPHAPSCVRGVMNLRGEVVTVIDLRSVLGLEPTVTTRRTCNVVVRSAGERIGLLADRVGDVVRTERNRIDPPPANVAGTDGRFFLGVCKLPNALLLVLDTEQVLALGAEDQWQST
jgi:purine-binding chemotaxis protein CheW